MHLTVDIATTGSPLISSQPSAQSRTRSQIVIPLSLTVWNITLPALGESGALGTIFAFNSTNTHDGHYGNESIESLYYPELPRAGIAESYQAALASERIPGDSCYLHVPKPIRHYELLAASGTKYHLR
jgi:hypothetical protein